MSNQKELRTFKNLLLVFITGGFYLLRLIPWKRLMTKQNLKRGAIGVGGCFLLLIVLTLMFGEDVEMKLTPVNETTLQEATLTHTLELQSHDVESILYSGTTIKVTSGSTVKLDVSLPTQTTTVDLIAVNGFIEEDFSFTIVRPAMDGDQKRKQRIFNQNNREQRRRELPLPTIISKDESGYLGCDRLDYQMTVPDGTFQEDLLYLTEQAYKKVKNEADRVFIFVYYETQREQESTTGPLYAARAFEEPNCSNPRTVEFDTDFLDSIEAQYPEIKERIE